MTPNQKSNVKTGPSYDNFFLNNNFLINKKNRQQTAKMLRREKTIFVLHILKWFHKKMNPLNTKSHLEFRYTALPDFLNLEKRLEIGIDKK